MSHDAGAHCHDVAVVGAGAAGTMAAIRAATLGADVVLVERNDSIGKKILVTGKGRCNLTNTAQVETFIERFGKQGQFLRSAFHAFFNTDLIEFFRSCGLETKVERQGRVFPASDSARSVVEALRKRLDECGVKIVFNKRLRAIERSGDLLSLRFEDGSAIGARRVIMAMGGSSYKATGSSGDGVAVARALGHAIVEAAPGLVPLTTKETWVKDLQGLGLENIRIAFSVGKKKVVSDVGELMFTHFGVSGPLVLDLSARVLALMGPSGEAKLAIDLKPGLDEAMLEKRILTEFKKNGKMHLKNILKGYLPQRMIDLFMTLSGIGAIVQANQITQEERRALVRLFKALPLTINGSLPVEEAMVTGGGVSTREIDPRTMASRLIPGLYFAGEIIDGCASSGGYNLQQAFSTGYLAGESAARSINDGERT